MKKQVREAGVVLVMTGIFAVVTVAAFVIIGDYSTESKKGTKAGWFPSCNHQIPHMIELRKVLGQEQLVILAISNETAEYLKNFAAARGVNYAVATPGGGALPAPFTEVRSISTDIG